MTDMTNLQRYGTAAVLLAVFAGIAGCGSDGAAPSKSSSASSATMSDEQILTVGREFAQCMRDHGISVGEPTVDQGRLKVPFATPAQQGAPPPKPETPATCQSILNRLPRSAMEDPPVTAEDIDKLEKFSQCVRQNGIPEWPDPKSDGHFALGGTSIDLKSDAFQTAKKACQQHYDGQIRANG